MRRYDYRGCEERQTQEEDPSKGKIISYNIAIIYQYVEKIFSSFDIVNLESLLEHFLWKFGNQKF